jgi:hypothetical protein
MEKNIEITLSNGIKVKLEELQIPKGIIRVTDDEDKLVCLVDGTIPEHYNKAFVETMEKQIIKKSLIGK